MAITNNKRMREFFEFGFEQVQAKSFIKECNFIANAKEFENEFQCALLFA